MRIRIILIAIISFFLASCTTARLGVPEQFSKEATMLHVKGLNGFTINQKLSFGDYWSSKVIQGWTRTSEKKDRVSNINTDDRLAKLFNIENANKTTSSGTKYQYSLYGAGFESKIFCLEKKSVEEQEFRSQIKFLGDFSKTENYQYSFSAAILPLIQNHDDPWQLVLYKNYDAKKDTARRITDLPYVEEEGFATNGKETITIRTVRTKKVTTSTGKLVNMPVQMPSGYELRIDDGVVGIIDTFDNNIWLYNELDGETKFILSSISSAILLRKIGSPNSAD